MSTNCAPKLREPWYTLLWPVFSSLVVGIVAYVALLEGLWGWYFRLHPDAMRLDLSPQPVLWSLRLFVCPPLASLLGGLVGGCFASGRKRSALAVGLAFAALVALPAAFVMSLVIIDRGPLQALNLFFQGLFQFGYACLSLGGPAWIGCLLTQRLRFRPRSATGQPDPARHDAH